MKLKTDMKIYPVQRQAKPVAKRKKTKIYTKMSHSVKWKQDHWEYWTTCVLRSGSALYILPLEINDSILSQRLVKFCSTKRKRIWECTLAWYLLDIFYLCSVSGDVKVSTAGEIEFVNFHVHFMSRLIAGLIMLLVADDLENLIQFFNTLLLMRRKFQVRWSVRFADICNSVSHAEQKISILIALAVVVCHVQPIFPLLMHLQARHSLRYWPSKFIPSIVYDSVPVTILYALNDLIFSYFAIFGSAFLIILTASYLALAHVWITLLCAKTKVTTMTFPMIMSILKEQQILNKISNFYLSRKIIPLFVAGGCFVMMQLVSSIIRSFDKLSFTPMYLNYFIGMIVLIAASQYVLDVGGKLRSISITVMSELSKGKGSFGYKRVAGCQDLRMYMGYSMYFEPISFLYFLRVVFDMSINHLIATT